MERVRLFALALGASLGLGCPSEPMLPPATRCEDDPRSEPYRPLLERTSRDGTFRFVLHEARPAPPAIGDNEWSFEILDTTGVEPDAVRLRGFTPDFGYGTVPLTSEATRVSHGFYRAGPFVVLGKGLWEFTIEVERAGVTDAVVIGFCADRSTHDAGPRPDADLDAGGPDAGIDASLDAGPLPIDCHVTAPTACTQPSLTYAADIAPLFALRCTGPCHNGSDRTWPLTSYSHVVDWKDDIRERMLNCSMPPIESGMRMPNEERQLIVEWLRCGYPP